MSIICNQVEHDAISKARAVELAKRHSPDKVAASRAKVREAVNPSGPVAEAAKGLSRRGKAGIALGATAAAGAAGAGGVALARRRRPETVAVAKDAGPFGVSKSSAQGTPESIREIAHDRGEHEGKSLRYCPKCAAGATKTVQILGRK